MGKNLPKNSKFKNYSKADKIIRFLHNPDDESIELSPSEQEKLRLLMQVHGYRTQYSTKQQIVATIMQVHDVRQRQAYNLINECEEVFGSIEGVNKNYERNFLLEISRKNIQIAVGTRNSKTISLAILAHGKLAGLDEQNVDVPDFSEFEPNQYNIVLPPSVLAVLNAMVESGALRLEDFVQPPDLKTLEIEQAKEISPDDE